MNERIREVREKMVHLGYTGTGLLDLHMIDADRAVVFWNGQQFGVYDFIRHTFID